MRVSNLAARVGNGNSLYGREIRERIAAHDRADRERLRLAAERRASAPAYLGGIADYPLQRRLERWIDAHPRAAARVHLLICMAAGAVLATLAWLWASQG